MRIGLFSDVYPPEINGVATATYTLAKVLKDHGHEVIVVTTAPIGQKEVTFNDGVCYIPGIVLKKLYGYRLTWIWNHKAINLIKKMNLDLIHVQTELGIGIFGRLAAKRLHIPLVYTYHTMYEDYTYYVTKDKKRFDIFAKKVIASLSRLVGETSTEFTTPSLKTKDALRGYGVKKYINIVPNGVDMSSFDRDTVDQKKIDEYKKEHGLEGKFVILLLGRIAKEKSHDVVLKNFKHYLEKHENKNVHLLVVGDGPDKINLESLVISMNLREYVTFTGKVPHEDVPFYYALSDLFTCASITETQGLTFNEAMAMKTMVLARYDDNLKFLLKDGVTGFYFDTPDSFSKKLVYIMNMDEESKEKILEAAYKTNNDQFSLDKYYERMMIVYEKAIRRYW